MAKEKEGSIWEKGLFASSGGFVSLKVLAN